MKTRTLLLGCAIATAMSATPAFAQESYMGEVQLFANTFCPANNTVDSNGQIMAISQNDALFTLLGTTYGGNGQTTFAIPDMRGRTPIGQGQGPGLSNIPEGQAAGTEQVTLTVAQMPAHMHYGYAKAVNADPNTDDPNNATLADFPSSSPIYNNTTAPNTNMAAGTVQVQPTGGNQPFQNLAPFLTMRFCTVQYGIYPSQP